MLIYDLFYELFVFIFSENVITIMPYSFITNILCFCMTFFVYYLILYWLPNKIIFGVWLKGGKD